MQILEFDTVVIGSGLAGLSAAYHSSKYGRVAIVTKSQLDVSNSYYAQGGIAAAIADEDSPEQHARDTLITGRGICDNDAVEVLVNEGRERVKELIDLGMQFDKENGKYVLGLEGGHTKRRILHAGGDATGKELTCFKLRLIREKKNVEAFEYVVAVKLLKHNEAIVGLQAYDFKTNKNIIFKTKAIIIATGGLSRVFARSTNPHTATGDGIALAYDAGARLADLEFVQFHPSALNIPGKEAYLISEAVRGEGAWLLNSKGERFMKDIHPLAELAPRDVVAYSIFKQIQESDQDHIFLSLKHLDKQKIKNRFKNIDKQLKEFGFDLTEDQLPIAPAAHYMVGGICTNLDAETNISGLFVCGEAASTGVMGANRLASNSLLECLVFGKRASEKAAKLVASEHLLEKPEPITLDVNNEKVFLKYQNELAQIMSKKLGIVRNREDLESAFNRFSEIVSEFDNNQHEYNLIKIRNMSVISKLIAQSALVREESRGGHIREDFQQENPDFKTHIIQQKNKNIEFEPIRK
ncbi:L-aspartate oxidase [Draconibacterium halophilum]|uniref:L-aspartate oxidase n=1 Tax=Draconibacterium halophilum TaxID=2706887 RepID=A0A6C0RIZ0_9BACT|nr:L-aspartate oxidase [Draconibacterium halophilum]QIA09822.1 L-aspartate oxidase [Draconibacterium halophilum]